MKPARFEGHNVVMGKGQPQYQELPAYRVGDDTGTIISCWELEPADKLLLDRTGGIWLSQLTFNGPLQPQLPSIVKPAALADLPESTRPNTRAAGGEGFGIDTKDVFLVAMADEGPARMGCNPFGFGCPDCGASFSFKYDVVEMGGHGQAKEHLLDLEVKRDEVETQRLRKHLGAEGTAAEATRQLVAVDDLVLQALNVVLPEEEQLGEDPEKRVAQLITILGMHREVLANYRATVQHIMKGVEIARDAVQEELNHQKLISVLGQSQMLIMALDALNTILPANKKPEPSKLILVGGGGRG